MAQRPDEGLGHSGRATAPTSAMTDRTPPDAVVGTPNSYTCSQYGAMLAQLIEQTEVLTKLVRKSQRRETRKALLHRETTREGRIARVAAWRRKKAAQTTRARRRKVDPSKAESAAKRAAKILTLKIEVFEHYCGGKPHCQCLGCPCDVIAFLQVDHKNGDGKNHVVNGHRMSGAELWSWIKRNNYPENFQILCGNCNNSKRDYAACKLYGTPHRG
jgi:hypothetical protein